MKSCICFLFLLFNKETLIAQLSENDIRMKAITTVIEGYNRQNFKTMKEPWFWIGKIIVTQKKLRQEFEPFYKTYGKASIDTVTNSSRYEYVAKLNMEKNSKERVFLKFMFTDNNKLEGMGFTYPPLIYKKSKKSNSINNSEFTSHVDTLLLRKYLKSKTKAFNGSVMVIDKGNPIYQKHFGYTDFITKNKLNDTSLYELASCSKQFTATAILILAQQGKLNLTDSIQKYIPDFPYHNITIENLLTHTSGLPDYEVLLDKVWDKSKFATNYDVIEQFKKYHPKILFNPNEQFEYSNTGYVILSVIIEKASGISYNDYLSNTIFKPLFMTHTRVYNTRRVKNETINNYAYGYVYSDELKKYILPDSLKQYKEVVYQDAITGDGTVNSCTKDLILWENELLKPSLISKENLEKAFSKHKLNNGTLINYGYGFFITGGGNSERLIFHTGGWPGYVTIFMHFPELQKAIVILSNNNYDNFTKMADDIAALLIY